MIAFAYYGAKNGLLAELLPLLPASDHYCEPFAGSATVLLNRKPSPIETMNDLNGDLVNFFRVLRDQPGELAAVLTRCAGRVALSGYDSPIMSELYPGWIRTSFKSRRVPMSRGSGLVRQEILWTNYDPHQNGRQATMKFETATP